MRHIVQQILLGSIVLFILDYVWLTKVMGPLFRKHMGHLMRPDVISRAALLVWVVMVVLIIFFVHKNTHVTSGRLSFVYGALLGGGMYAIYDFTNYATLKGWHLPTALLDIARGALVCGIVAVVLRYFRR